MAIECNKDHFNFHFTNLDFIQISEYNSENQGMYTKHHDVFWCNPEHPYHRKLSCTIQLSDPSSYTGGEFVFHDLEKAFPSEDDKVKMKNRGTAIMFPSFIPHSVEPVLSGTRYGLTAWFEGPKWR
jgi:PKHD-type hydroxylase